MLFVVLLTVVVLVAWAISANRTNKVTPQNLERQLLNMCLGDKDMAIRLTMLELKRNPALSHSDAIKAAIQSYKRDS